MAPRVDLDISKAHCGPELAHHGSRSMSADDVLRLSVIVAAETAIEGLAHASLIAEACGPFNLSLGVIVHLILQSQILQCDFP